MWDAGAERPIVCLAQYIDVLTVHLWDLYSSPAGYSGLGL